MVWSEKSVIYLLFSERGRSYGFGGIIIVQVKISGKVTEIEFVIAVKWK